MAANDKEKRVNPFPDRWIRTTLSTIVLLEKGRKPKVLVDAPSDLPYPYINIEAFEKGIFSQYTDGDGATISNATDVLIVWDGTRCGLVGKGIKGAVGSTLARLFSSGVNFLYIFYFLQSIYTLINSKPRGVGIPHIDPGLFWNIDIPLPPLAEQYRIVAKIEELFTQLDAAEAALRRAKANLERYRRSVLQAAVMGQLTEDWRRGHQGYDPWKKMKLGEIGELNRGKSKHRPRDAAFLYGGSYPFIQTGDIRHANGVIREFHQTYNEEGLKQSRLWPAGTLCITIAANIAETAILGFDSCFPDSVVGFISNSALCDTRYVEYFFRTAKSDLERYAPATAQKNINLSILSNLEIPLPPVDEQKQIISLIDEMFSRNETAEISIAHSLHRISRLRQSILEDAFNGRLVNQNPGDEPAAVLLQRIQAEREGQAAYPIRKSAKANHGQ